MPMMPVASTPSVMNMAISTRMNMKVFMAPDLKPAPPAAARAFAAAF
jgi:hypothetical protein